MRGVAETAVALQHERRPAKDEEVATAAVVGCSSNAIPSGARTWPDGTSQEIVSSRRSCPQTDEAVGSICACPALLSTRWRCSKTHFQDHARAALERARRSHLLR